MQSGTPPPEALADVSETLLRMGVEGAPFEDTLATFCTGLNAAGLSLMRAHITLRTNHPQFGSLAHRWVREEGTHMQSFPRRSSPGQEWVQSPLYALLAADADRLHLPLDQPEHLERFPFLEEMKDRGATDYIVYKRFFSTPDESLAVDPNDPPQGCIMSLATDAVGGYSTEAFAAIDEVLPSLMLALKAAANHRMAGDIAATYLGGDAGARVLSGDILRGSVERIDAVICYFDLTGFTKLSERLTGEEIIELLNDYFGIAVDVVQEHGGNVLKFMGDGMLAIFNVAKTENASAAALDTTMALRQAMAEKSAEREAKELTTTGFTLALHRGEVLYGNIGGTSRLDFTVIGPAVNTTARLSGMCAHVDQNIVISANVARPMLDVRPELVSLGIYRLRGVAERQELFTLD